MKRLCLIALFFTALFADTALLLPHRWQDARHELNRLVRDAETTIVIVTDTLDDIQLQRSLRLMLKQERSVVLMTSSKATASEWAMYRTMEACLLPTGSELGFSLLSVEGDTACALNMPLRTETMQRDYGVLVCGHAEEYTETLRLLRQECKGYFER